MSVSMSRDQWVRQVDREIGRSTHRQFPPTSPQPFLDVVVASWRAFQALQLMRKNDAYSKDLGLAAAEHYT